MSTPPAEDVPPSDSQEKKSPERPKLRVLFPGFWQYGRYYGSYRPDKYLFPLDDEELKRLDLINKFFLETRKQRLCNYNFDVHGEGRVLDLGTGTGVWANNVSQQYKDLQVIAVDMHAAWAKLIPGGVKNVLYDLEEPTWSDKIPGQCDLVHVRLLFGCLKTELWPQFYINAFEKTLPGDGYFEQVEIDYTVRFEDNPGPEPSDVGKWTDQFLRSMDRSGRSARVDPQRTRRLLAEAGFVDIKEEVFRCCSGPWPDNEHEALAARWFNSWLCLGFQSQGYKPLIEFGDMEGPEAVKELAAKAKYESCHMQWRMYHNMYVWTARRPDPINGVHHPERNRIYKPVQPRLAQKPPAPAPAPAPASAPRGLEVLKPIR